MCYKTKNNLTGYHTELDRKSSYKKKDPEFHMLQVFIFYQHNVFIGKTNTFLHIGGKLNSLNTKLERSKM